MEKAFAISAELVHATMDYHRAVQSGASDADLNKAYRLLSHLQNELSAICEEEVAAEKTQ